MFFRLPVTGRRARQDDASRQKETQAAKEESRRYDESVRMTAAAAAAADAAAVAKEVQSVNLPSLKTQDLPFSPYPSMHGPDEEESWVPVAESIDSRETTVIVGAEATESVLATFFQSIAVIRGVRHMNNGRTLVRFGSVDAARRALQLNGHKLRGHSVSIERAAWSHGRLGNDEEHGDTASAAFDDMNNHLVTQEASDLRDDFKRRRLLMPRDHVSC